MTRRIAIAALLLAGCATTQARDTVLGSDALDALLTGNTIYIDVPAGGPMGDGGEMPLYYGADGSVKARLPTGATMVGAYTIAGDRYCVDWDPAPTNSCTSIVRGEGGGLAFVDPDEGDERGTVTRIVPGDVESLGS